MTGDSEGLSLAGALAAAEAASPVESVDVVDAELDLRPGDRLVMLTDGIFERTTPELDLTDLIVRTGDLHPREAARLLTRAVLHAHSGHLSDDATVLCLDWYGTGQPRRSADTGADLSQASGGRPG